MKCQPIPDLEHPANMQWLFVVQELALTMKRLKETITVPWTQTIEASHFFMPFMVKRLITQLCLQEV